MPHPTDPARYPLSFPEAIKHTIATAPTGFVIPCPDPHALRSQFYGYFRALRLHGDTALADALVVYVRKDHIELRTRDSTPAGQTVEAALRAARSPRDPQPFTFESPEQENIPSA